MVDLSVIIVSYNTKDLLRACLHSVVQQAGHISTEVIVVDNGSLDGSREMVRARFPHVCLVESENVGFAAGCNKGIAIASGRFLLLLNPDTVVLDDALGAFVRFLDAHPRAGAAGGRLLNPDGSFQHAAFRFPNLWMSFFDFFPLNHRLLNSRLNGRYPREWYIHPFQIDHPLGACLAVRREVVDQVGALDESFFMYCEEIDWCLRIKRAGWEIWYVPDAVIIHHGAQSTRQFRHRMFVELHRSRYRLFAKYYSPTFCWGARQIVRLGLSREIWRAWRDRQRGRIAEEEYDNRLAAYREVWRL